MIVQTLKQAREILRGMLQEKECGFDTETYGVEIGGVKYSALQLNRARLLTFQLDSEKYAGCVFVSDKMGKGAGFLDFAALHDDLQKLMMSLKVLKIMHNANYDVYVMHNHGIRVRRYYCTMVAGACQDENMSNSLKDRAVLVQMLLKKTRTVDFKNVNDLAAYGADDAVATRKLKILYDGEYTHKLVRTSKGMVSRKLRIPGKLTGVRRRFFEKQEMPIVRVVAKMERMGARIDLPKLAAIHQEIEIDKNKHLKAVYKLAGGVFNLNSAQQLNNFLFSKLGLKVVDACLTPKGAPSTNARALFYLKPQHTIVDSILEYRRLEKLQSVYTNTKSGLPYFCDSRGYIHSTANNVGTHTFRFSYSNPNLQTIPSKRDKYGIRDCFIAPDDHYVAVFDYSQIEVRMQAIFSHAKNMVDELCKPKGDIYLRTAKEFESDDPDTERQMYKVIVLALQYGMGPWNLADQMTQGGYPTTPRDATARIDTYFHKVYPEIPAMWYDLFQEHKRKGYVTTLLGRPRKVAGFVTEFHPDSRRLKLNSYERSLVNNVMQGSAADWIKQAMLRISRSEIVKDCRYRPALQIHDELVGYIPMRYKKCFQSVLDIACETPKEPFVPTRQIIVPIRVEGGVGTSWKQAKP